MAAKKSAEQLKYSVILRKKNGEEFPLAAFYALGDAVHYAIWRRGIIKNTGAKDFSLKVVGRKSGKLYSTYRSDY